VQTWKLIALKKLDMVLPLKEGGLFDWHRPLCRSSKTFFYGLEWKVTVSHDSLAPFPRSDTGSIITIIPTSCNCRISYG
jgi:hypothetical protein